MAGYRLKVHRNPIMKSNQANIEMIVNWVITGSSIKNIEVMNKPTVNPIAQLIRTINNPW